MLLPFLCCVQHPPAWGSRYKIDRVLPLMSSRPRRRGRHVNNDYNKSRAAIITIIKVQMKCTEGRLINSDWEIRNCFVGNNEASSGRYRISVGRVGGGSGGKVGFASDNVDAISHCATFLAVRLRAGDLTSLCLVFICEIRITGYISYGSYIKT